MCDRLGKIVFLMFKIETHNTAVPDAEINPLKNLVKMNQKLSLIRHHGTVAH